jgi:hypothetical protein
MFGVFTHHRVVVFHNRPIWSEVEYAATINPALARHASWVLESAGHVDITGLPMLLHRQA